MSDFLFEFKMGCKTVQTTSHLAQELLMNIQCSGGSRSSAKKTRALQMRSAAAGHWKLTTTNWEQSSKLILLKLQEKLPKNSTLLILIIQHLKQIGKVEKFDKWVPHELTEKKKTKKKPVLNCRLLLFYMTTNHFSIELWCAIKPLEKKMATHSSILA